MPALLVKSQRFAVVAILIGATAFAGALPSQASPSSPAGVVPPLPGGTPTVPHPVVDASSASTGAAARAIAQKFGHRVQDLSQNTESATTYVNPDGSSTLEESADVIRVQRAGSWVPVDQTLTVQSDGSIGPKVSPVDVKVGGAGSTTVASLTIGSGTVSYDWASPLPAPSLLGASATYSGVLPGVDLVATATGDGIETSLVYHSAQAVAAARSITLPVSATNLTPTVGTDGSVAYADATGTTVVQTPAPKAWDSRRGGDVAGPGAGPVVPVVTTVQDASAPSGARRTTMRATSVDGDSLTQTLQVPAALTSDPNVSYPLIVDPTVSCTTCTETMHGYVENDGDDEINSSFDGGEVHVGTFDGGTTRTRGVYAFHQGPSHGATISSATLKLGNNYSWSCTGKSMTVYKATPFTTSATWSSATLATTTNSVSKTFALGHDSSCAADEVDFGVTGIVADSANDSSTSYYFQLRADSETDSTYWKKFQSDAVLAVTYNRPPATPTSVGFKSASPSKPSCVKGSNRPTIDATQASSWQATLTDPDGNPVKAQFAWFNILTPTTTHIATSGVVASGKVATVAFAGGPNIFIDGHSYGFTVRAFDGSLYSGYASGSVSTSTCEFTIADPAPNTPSSLKFASPALPCPPTSSVRGDQSMEFSAAISDPDASKGTQVYATFTVKVGATTKWTWTSTPAGNRTLTSVAMPANTIPDATDFTWSVTAYNAVKSSATATCSGHTDDGAPPPPAITSTGAFVTTGTAPTAYIGDTDTITLTSSDAIKYEWQLTSPSGTVNVPSSLGACGTVDGNGVHTVCASQGTGWNTFPIRATMPEFKITAVGYNSAGTVSPTGANTFDVNEYDPSHAWLTDTAPDDGMTIPDTPNADGTPGTAPMTTSPTGATWVDSAGSDSNPQSGPDTYGSALELDGTGYASTAPSTPSPITVDMTHSFTVGLWVRPTMASGSTVNVAIADEGAVFDGFIVGQYTGYWFFCMPHTQNNTGGAYDADCVDVAQPADGSYINSWTFLAATWDSTAQQMQFSVNGVAAPAVSHTTTGSSSGPILLGADQYVNEYPTWVGDILNPVVYPGIADSGQLANLQQCGLPQDLNASCS